MFLSTLANLFLRHVYAWPLSEMIWRHHQFSELEPLLTNHPIQSSTTGIITDYTYSYFFGIGEVYDESHGSSLDVSASALPPSVTVTVTAPTHLPYLYSVLNSHNDDDWVVDEY